MQNDLEVIGVIPARYQSTRLPFKLTRALCGKPLLQWVWERASQARLLDSLVIACDDARLCDLAKSFGAKVMMTSPKHSSGTDRVAEAVRDTSVKIVLNIQADEPLINPLSIDRLAEEMLSNPQLVMATLRRKIDDESDVLNPNIVKVVCDKDAFALYFSRFAIPYYRQAPQTKVYYKHLGIYAYTKDFLYTFKNLPFSYLEDAEKLEQLRALEAGYKIKVVETIFNSWGVDTEEDLQKLEAMLKEKQSVIDL
jgi:3-deoxy-manno-octulosonate cytidylyltransferase (CMP-KDO synthetase)